VSPRARSRARGSLVQAAAWGFTTVAALVCVLGTVTAAAAGGGTGHPAAPSPLPVPAPAPPVRHALWGRPLGWLAALLIIFGISYGLAMFAASRRDPVRPTHRSDNSALDPGGPDGARPRQAMPDEAKGARPGPALLDVPADSASLDAPDDLYFVFLMPCRGSRKGISR
jgi:hypothetical protein